jgi:hypothetical protein
LKLATSRKRSLAVIALVAAIGTTFAACGGDDDDDAASSDTTTATTADGGGAEGVSAELCDLNVQIASATAGLSQAESPEDAKAAYEESGLGDLLDQAAALEKPEAIADQLTEAVGILQTAGETGDTSPMADFDTTEIDGYFYDNCDYQQVEVSATNSGDTYEFVGIPDTLDATATSFKVTNDGDELHEMILFTKAPGVTESFDDILALPEEEAGAKVMPVGGAVVEIGKTGYFAADLPAGDYMAICFIPQGTKSFADEIDAPPHFLLGMKHEITVS